MRKLGTRDFMDPGLVRAKAAPREKPAEVSRHGEREMSIFALVCREAQAESLMAL